MQHDEFTVFWRKSQKLIDIYNCFTFWRSYATLEKKVKENKNL